MQRQFGHRGTRRSCANVLPRLSGLLQPWSPWWVMARNRTRWLPADILPTPQALFPNAASSWEWAVGQGIRQFWIMCWKARRVQGICRHVPCLDIRIDCTGCIGPPTEPRAGDKCPLAALQCLNPPGDQAVEAVSYPEPGASLAARKVSSLLPFNTSLIFEQDAAKVEAYNPATLAYGHDTRHKTMGEYFSALH